MVQATGWQSRFLQALEDTGVIARACRIAGVSQTTVSTRRANDADFAAAVDEALELAADTMEMEARRRAVEGVNEPVVHQGQLTPIWERDADGNVVMIEERVPQPAIGGQPQPDLVTRRPKQLVIDGTPQFLTVKKYSDSLLQFLLKGRRRKVFGDKLEATGADGAPLIPAVDETTAAARIAALMAIAQSRKDAPDDCSDLG